MTTWTCERCGAQWSTRAVGDCYQCEARQGGSNRYGVLCDYKTGDLIRPAKAEEQAASRAAAERDGGRGVIEVDGRRCYVEE